MSLKQHQPPMTIEAQIENLKSLGLIINDEDKAKNFLNDVSYFRLVKAYSLGLKQKNSNYDAGVTFDELVELYLFNANFRQILFNQIERVEINLRCRLGNYFSIKYGVLGYEDSANFVNASYHMDLLNEIQNEISRSRKTAFVKNFKNNYVDGKIPMYALVELFSFGTLSKFYKNMNLSKTPALYKQYAKAGISNIRVYATLLCLKHLLPNDRHWYNFVDTIGLLFEKYPHVKIELMGFPKNDWKELLIK